MTINKQFSFECAVQSLARVLAQIKPTPWEKVSVSLSLFHSYFLSNLSFVFAKSIKSISRLINHNLNKIK